MVYRVWETIVVITVLIIAFLHPYNACFFVKEDKGKIFLKCWTEISWSGLRQSAQPVIVIDWFITGAGAYTGIDGGSVLTFLPSTSLPPLLSPFFPLHSPFPGIPTPSLLFLRPLSLPYLFPSFSSPFSRVFLSPPYRPPLNQLGGLGERCKLPQLGPRFGRSPGRNRIWCTIELLESHW